MYSRFLMFFFTLGSAFATDPMYTGIGCSNHPTVERSSARTRYTSAPERPFTRTIEAYITATRNVPSPSSSVSTILDADNSTVSDTGYMVIVNKWRLKMGLESIQMSPILERNAQKTVNDGKGQMIHQLNPGSFAQVLAPGSSDNFEQVFVGGWLCERPNLSGLDGVCTTMSAHWSYDGQTGHADILSSSQYTQIGCALANGIWGCDLA